MNTVLSTKSAAGTLRRVEEVTAPHVEDGLTSRLAELRLWIAADLVDVDAALASLEPGDTPMHGAARHLLDLGGKRLRPLCVALAARAGSGFDRAARDLAVAAELVHSATLLHDDVVDLGDRRRGAPTARVIYGNIASIYAGDWLLVEALRRIRSTGHLDLLDRALDTLDQLLGAEALQLALRGTVPARSSYFEVVEGKTASLFRWAMAAGARAGGWVWAGRSRGGWGGCSAPIPRRAGGWGGSCGERPSHGNSGIPDGKPPLGSRASLRPGG